MSKVERSTGREGRPLFRWVAAGSAAVFLLSSAYSASWGQDIDDIYDDDDGMSAKELALIATGAALGLAGLWLLLGGGDDDDDEEEEQKVQLPGNTGGAVSELRLVPSQKTLAPGERAYFDLQARAGGEWHSVTAREEAAVQVKGASALVAQDGAKNGFCLPITAAPRGEEITVEGRFNGHSVSTTVTLLNGGA